jgi:hypothetical protein
MSQTLLYFGIFCLVAAIAGGGLKALGFQMGALSSTLRQIILGSLGIALMVSAEWSPIVGILFPPKQVTVTQTLTLDTGASINIPLSLKRAGSVVVVIENESERHDVFVTIVSASQAQEPSSSRQIGQSVAFSRDLPAGPATIGVFNFAANPKLTFTLRITHPE